MRISLITPTGGRPEAFALTEKYMARQTVDWHEWIVVDDCVPATDFTLATTVVYPEDKDKWRLGVNTQPQNLRAAIHLVTGDVIAIIEDDDWYAPNYLERMIVAMGHGVAVGTYPVYYNLQYRAWRNLPTGVSPLASTVFRSVLIPDFLYSLSERYIDKAFWERISLHRPSQYSLIDSGEFVGMKGLPGRAGLGVGHHRDWYFGNDNNFKKLKELVGEEDAAVYAELYKKTYAASNLPSVPNGKLSVEPGAT